MWLKLGWRHWEWKITNDQRFDFGFLVMREYTEILPGMQKLPTHICKYFSEGLVPKRESTAFTRNLSGVSNVRILGRLAYLILVFSSETTYAYPQS